MKHIGDILRGNFDYRKKLNTGQWDAFRKRQYALANFSCAMCRRGGVELNVHHLFYEADREPWEYEDHEVVVLCRDCHEATHIQLKKFRQFVFGKMTPHVFQIINGALAVGLEHYDPLKVAHAIQNLMESPGSVERFAADLRREKPVNV